MSRAPRQRRDDPQAEPRAAAAPAPPAGVAQVLALQRTAGNAAVSRALLQREMTEEQATEKVKDLKTVVSGGGTKHPLATDSHRHHFLRAGKEFFGSYEGTIGWFSAIRSADVPGGIVLHDRAATRLEAVKAAMGGDMPKRGGGFQLRADFDENSHYSRLSHHTLGLAVDYDITDMVRIGSARTEPNKDGKPVETTHTADFLEAVTGSPSHEDLGGAQRRALIKQMGDTTERGGDVGKVKGADQLLASISSETDRMAEASAAFQKSLGDQRDKFLELRNQYHATKNPAEKKKIMEEVPAVVKPWLDAVENAAQSLRSTATAAGLDPDKLPSGDAVKAQAAAKAKTAQAAVDMGLRYKVAEGEEEKPLVEKDKTVLEAWEKEFKLTGLGAEKTIMRCAYVAMVADALARNLAAVAGADVKLKHYADLKKMLVSDPAFLFGASTAKTADTPSLAQMVESGFFTPGKPGQAAEDQGNFDAKFIQEMAKHGFDAGVAWGGPYTDSMHFELVTDKLL